jgi:enterochelin esterase-like enzyme
MISLFGDLELLNICSDAFTKVNLFNMKKHLIFLILLFMAMPVAISQNGAQIQLEKVSDLKLASGKIMRIENFPSKFVQPRNVDIWLPETYSNDIKYDVLYMHDGQMLFDADVTWNKQEWKVDEWASKLMNEKITRDFIIVAVYNISNIRWNDYFPAKAFNYISQEDKELLNKKASDNTFDMTLNADNYLQFLTKELKPYVDSNFSVKKDQESTFIAGSSMGGLISMYAICEYPEVFGGAACISTHWPGIAPSDNNPIPDAFFAYMKDNLPSPKDHRLYFDYGTKTLDEYYPQYAQKVNDVLKMKGYTDKNARNLKFEGADHSENSWNQRLDIPLMYLLGKNKE